MDKRGLMVSRDDVPLITLLHQMRIGSIFGHPMGTVINKTYKLITYNCRCYENCPFRVSRIDPNDMPDKSFITLDKPHIHANQVKLRKKFPLEIEAIIGKSRASISPKEMREYLINYASQALKVEDVLSFLHVKKFPNQELQLLDVAKINIQLYIPSRSNLSDRNYSIRRWDKEHGIYDEKNYYHGGRTTKEQEPLKVTVQDQNISQFEQLEFDHALLTNEKEPVQETQDPMRLNYTQQFHTQEIYPDFHQNFMSQPQTLIENVPEIQITNIQETNDQGESVQVQTQVENQNQQNTTQIKENQINDTIFKEAVKEISSESDFFIEEQQNIVDQHTENPQPNEQNNQQQIEQQINNIFNIEILNEAYINKIVKEHSLEEQLQALLQLTLLRNSIIEQCPDLKIIGQNEINEANQSNIQNNDYESVQVYSHNSMVNELIDEKLLSSNQQQNNDNQTHSTQENNTVNQIVQNIEQQINNTELLPDLNINDLPLVTPTIRHDNQNMPQIDEHILSADALQHSNCEAENQNSIKDQNKPKSNINQSNSTCNNTGNTEHTPDVHTHIQSLNQLQQSPNLKNISKFGFIPVMSTQYTQSRFNFMPTQSICYTPLLNQQNNQQQNQLNIIIQETNPENIIQVNIQQPSNKTIIQTLIQEVINEQNEPELLFKPPKMQEEIFQSPFKLTAPKSAKRVRSNKSDILSPNLNVNYEELLKQHNLTPVQIENIKKATEIGRKADQNSLDLLNTLCKDLDKDNQ
ncbi:Hypothetical_protein [Hexamita inflata]|uniref:Hypothetical_protein n=1 Tax=Hexamita inflata TaxID=28002 RepID=A0AA86Q1B6_9EUKA|nr:Hypothetical protein HINF_LOCUS35517 [Hexamita inflata]